MRRPRRGPRPAGRHSGDPGGSGPGEAVLCPPGLPAGRVPMRTGPQRGPRVAVTVGAQGLSWTGGCRNARTPEAPRLGCLGTLSGDAFGGGARSSAPSDPHV